ncbi:MAG: glycogen/starch synthase, partial [Burkholderiaceae bacterium]
MIAPSGQGPTADPRRRPRILHVTAEAAPFVRTGGLGDVLGALPTAQAALGADVRVLVPGYPTVVATLSSARVVAAFPAPRQGGFCRLLAAPSVSEAMSEAAADGSSP